MKIFIFAILLLNSLSAMAWEKVASCDNDMFVIDRQVNSVGRYDYQAVFRGNLVQAMINQNLLTSAYLNHSGEFITTVAPHQSGNEASGMIEKRLGFTFSNRYTTSNNYSIILYTRGSQLGNYIFNNCTFKYGRLL